MSDSPAVSAGPVVVEERRIDGGPLWVALRARGAQWSIVTPQEAAQLGAELVRRFGGQTPDSSGPPT